MNSEMRESKFTNEDLETISRTWNSNKYTEHTAMLLASELLRARALLARTEAGADDPILRGLARAVGEIDPDDGRWVSCSGCYETEDGHPVGDYPHSPILCCALGAGCSECGGLGAVWDTTDYAAFAEEQMADHPQDASGDAVAELIAAADVLNTGAKHGLSTYPEDWKRLDAALDAMQAKGAK